MKLTALWLIVITHGCVSAINSFTIISIFQNLSSSFMVWVMKFFHVSIVTLFTSSFKRFWTSLSLNVLLLDLKWFLTTDQAISIGFNSQWYGGNLSTVLFCCRTYQFHIYYTTVLIVSQHSTILLQPLCYRLPHLCFGAIQLCLFSSNLLLDISFTVGILTFYWVPEFYRMVLGIVQNNHCIVLKFRQNTL